MRCFSLYSLALGLPVVFVFASPDISFAFDIFDGPGLQDSTASKPPQDLEYTTGGGVPYPQPYEAQRISETGPLLLQDFHLIESLAHFARERIPERVVHAKGAGAHGYFETTTDFAKQYTMADLFQRVGERTPVTVRFSTVGGEKGSSDAARDPRGFSIKQVPVINALSNSLTNNLPVFFIRDPAKFPNFIHTQKRNPQTNLKDHDVCHYYLSSNPESLYQVMRLFSDLGTPAGFRFMNGWSGHSYRLVHTDGSFVYVKVSLYSDQGIRNHTNSEATELSGSNPDFLTQDLYEAIEQGDTPSWTAYFQVLTADEAEKYRYNVLDLTKEWDPKDVPLHEVGRLHLTQNPANYFAEIEQAGFSPSHMVEGWEPSADPVLQSRLFSYPDAHRYRLGVNYQQIPVNCPLNPVANFQRDGHMNVDGNQGSRPNYPSTVQPLNLPNRPYYDNHTLWIGSAVRYLSTISDIDFEWPRYFWGNMSQTDQNNFVDNVVGHLGQVISPDIRLRQANVFSRADRELGMCVHLGLLRLKVYRFQQVKELRKESMLL
ncbi:catalase-domain-containing protein [Hysterangium stoloniferum]|nr:catalase-domain-containing protein [Hysterangium stoloniferum]